MHYILVFCLALDKKLGSMRYGGMLESIAWHCMPEIRACEVVPILILANRLYDTKFDTRELIENDVIETLQFFFFLLTGELYVCTSMETQSKSSFGRQEGVGRVVMGFGSRSDTDAEYGMLATWSMSWWRLPRVC